MSKHFAQQRNVNRELLSFEVGYDRPLSRFFISIEKDGTVLYDSLWLGFDQEQDNIWLCTVMASYGLVIPPQLLEMLAVEEMFGGSNQTVQHPEYVQTEGDRALLASGFRQFFPDKLPMPKVAIWCWWSESVTTGDYSTIENDSYSIAAPSRLIQVPNALSAKPDENVICGILETLRQNWSNRLDYQPGESTDEALLRILGYRPLVLS